VQRGDPAAGTCFTTTTREVNVLIDERADDDASADIDLDALQPCRRALPEILDAGDAVANYQEIANASRVGIVEVRIAQESKHRARFCHAWPVLWSHPPGHAGGLSDDRHLFVDDLTIKQMNRTVGVFRPARIVGNHAYRRSGVVQFGE